MSVKSSQPNSALIEKMRSAPFSLTDKAEAEVLIEKINAITTVTDPKASRVLKATVLERLCLDAENHEAADNWLKSEVIWELVEAVEAIETIKAV